MNTGNLLKGEIDIGTKKSINAIKLLDKEIGTIMSRFKMFNSIPYESQMNTFTNSLNKSSAARKKEIKLLAQQIALTKIIQKEKQKEMTATAKLNKSFLGMGFTLLFTGMALKRVFTDFFKTIFNNYKEIMGQTSEFNQLTNQLGGAWTFLKFTLMDALMQSGLFQSVIGFIVRMTNAISEFTSKHPEITQIIIIFTVLMIVISTLAMVFGQAALAFSTFGATGILTAGAFALKILGVVGAILLLSIAIVALNEVFQSNMKPVWKLLLSIGIIFVTILGIAALLGVTISLPFLIVAGVIAVVITGLILLTQKLGGLGNAFKALGIFILRILAFIGDAIWISLINPIKSFLSMINGVISALHKIGKAKNISLIDTSSLDLNLGKNVDKMRDDLLAETVDIETPSLKDSLTEEFNNMIPQSISDTVGNLGGGNSEILDELRRQTELQQQQNEKLDESNISSTKLNDLLKTNAESVGMTDFNLSKYISSTQG